ncbi:hypothetical protein, conserved [Eimeria maxima]|uniref:Uncharacterized protein n=1 Tax=Eimeria maxima TaxID=5804 RepID=U6M9G6_EIMMA|nr:hypothetical protein, conserved [Eimeria maxima]CDJ60867.1 hypothetical protein, conserved [Eimeria maxima]
MARNCLRRRAFGAVCDLTVQDVIFLFFPCTWTVSPRTIPMYWSLISALPASVMAFNYYVFQRAAIIQNGLSRFTIGELSQVMRLFGLLVVCTFLILAVVSGVQFSQCTTCSHDCFSENAFWCLVTMLWLLWMACCSPSPRQLAKLAYTHETIASLAAAADGRVLGRVAMGDDATFMPADIPAASADNFLRAGVHPDLVAHGKVAPAKTAD